MMARNMLNNQMKFLSLIILLFIGCGEKTDISESIQYNNRDAFIKIRLDSMYPVPKCTYEKCPTYYPNKNLKVYSEDNFFDDNKVLVKTKFKLIDDEQVNVKDIDDDGYFYWRPKLKDELLEHTHIYGYNDNGLITELYENTPFVKFAEHLSKFEYDSDRLLIKHNKYFEKGFDFEMEDDSLTASAYRFTTKYPQETTTYIYKNGRLVKIEDWTGANFTDYIDFKYNSKGQIETMVKYSEGAIITGLDGSDKEKTYYKYDSSGNVITP